MAERFKRVIWGTILLTAGFFIGTFYLQILAFKQQDDLTYPDKAISFLKADHTSGELFSLFNWGGYLDWKYPQKRVFVDGRMPIWYFQAPKGQLNSAFASYIAITTGQQPFEPVFDQFKVSMVLYPNLKDNVFLKMLEQKQWKKVYSDNEAVIYQHP